MPRHAPWIAFALAIVAAPALAQTVIDTSDPGQQQITVTARKLDQARESITPALGANDYVIDQPAISDYPQGADRPFNQTLLQTPGFSQDSFGQLHVRNEHANLQYRINGIILPEGVTGFGQALDSRFIDRIDVLTGALPAQYGYRTSGVVNITTKSGAFDQGGVADLYGGSHDTVEPSLEYGGATDTGLNYYVTGSFLHGNEGVENPTASYNPVHDGTDQERGFAYLSQILSPTTRLSAMLGTSEGHFQIPDNPGQSPQFNANGTDSFDSAELNERQVEFTHFGLLALQGSGDDYDYQLAPFIRYAQTRFTPDETGDLIFNGFADSTKLASTSSGVQFDARYDVADSHTLRSGFFTSVERTGADNSSELFTNVTGATNEFGNAQDSVTPYSITDDQAKTGYLYGVYLQDEWQLAQTLTMNYGGRFDIVNAYRNENQISPRLNFVYKPVQGTTLHAGYARNFTPPPQELVATPSLAKYAGTTQAPGVSESDPVKAEREHYFDAGGTQTLLTGWDAGLDGYYKIKRNLLDEGQFGESLLYSPFNYAFGRVYGLEGTTSYRLGGFTTYANLSYGQEKGKTVTSGQDFFSADELAYIASHAIHTDHDQKWTSSAGVSYKFTDGLGSLTPSSDLIFGSGLRSSPDDYLSPNGTHLPSYWQINLGLAQTLDNAAGVLNGVTLRMDVVNTADYVYQLRDGSGVGVGAPQYGPRREVFFGVSKKF